MEVNCFQILLIDVTFYLYHVQKVVPNVLIKMNICDTGGRRVNKINLKPAYFYHTHDPINQISFNNTQSCIGISKRREACHEHASTTIELDIDIRIFEMF